MPARPNARRGPIRNRSDAEYTQLKTELEPPEDTTPILDEDDEAISTHTIETATEDTPEEEPEEANQTDSEEETPEEEQEEAPPTDDETEPNRDNKTDLNINLEPSKTEIFNAKDLLNSTYEANKFIEYLTFENAHKDETTGQCLIGDVSKINPTKYHTHKDRQLKEITDPFIDNIMLFKLIDEKQTFKQGGITLINKEVCGFWNTTIRKTAKNIL